MAAAAVEAAVRISEAESTNHRDEKAEARKTALADAKQYGWQTSVVNNNTDGDKAVADAKKCAFSVSTGNWLDEQFSGWNTGKGPNQSPNEKGPAESAADTARRHAQILFVLASLLQKDKKHVHLAQEVSGQMLQKLQDKKNYENPDTVEVAAAERMFSVVGRPVDKAGKEVPQGKNDFEAVVFNGKEYHPAKLSPNYKQDAAYGAYQCWQSSASLRKTFADKAAAAAPAEGRDKDAAASQKGAGAAATVETAAATVGTAAAAAAGTAPVGATAAGLNADSPKQTKRKSRYGDDATGPAAKKGKAELPANDKESTGVAAAAATAPMSDDKEDDKEDDKFSYFVPIPLRHSLKTPTDPRCAIAIRLKSRTTDTYVRVVSMHLEGAQNKDKPPAVMPPAIEKWDTNWATQLRVEQMIEAITGALKAFGPVAHNEVVVLGGDFNEQFKQEDVRNYFKDAMKQYHMFWVENFTSTSIYGAPGANSAIDHLFVSDLKRIVKGSTRVIRSLPQRLSATGFVEKGKNYAVNTAEDKLFKLPPYQDDQWPSDHYLLETTLLGCIEGEDDARQAMNGVAAAGAAAAK